MWTLVLAPRSAPSTCSAIEPGDEVDAQLARGAARPAERRAVERLRAGRGLLRRAQHGPLLRQHDQLGAARGGRARQPVGRLEVAVAIGRGAELHGCGEHGGPLLGSGLTRQSIPGAARIPRMRMYKAWTWVGAFGPELMLCAASARVGPARTAWWAVWDGERLHERTFRRARSGHGDAGARARVDGVLDLVVEPGAPWAVRTGRDLDAQAAGARARHARSAARSTCPAWSTSRPAATRARCRGGGAPAPASSPTAAP